MGPADARPNELKGTPIRQSVLIAVLAGQLIVPHASVRSTNLTIWRGRLPDPMLVAAGC